MLLAEPDLAATVNKEGRAAASPGVKVLLVSVLGMG
jgi:hypothetical protein